MIVDIADFLALRGELPVVDVRSEGEFDAGHIPGAANLPLLNNSERHSVGIEYKEHGQLQAIKAGFRLVGPRLNAIIDEAERLTSVSRELLVHCWRGGMRSSNFCHFVGMARIKTHQLRGGYKAYRAHAFESFSHPLKLIVLGGSTGSGKSNILRALARNGEQVIDLERLASHKGSAFGGLMMPPQPTTEQFQNDLFEDIAKLDPDRPVWIEDESIAIGRIFLPDSLWKQMSHSPVIEMMVDKTTRISRLVAEYGGADKDAFLASMEKITRKLGGQNFKAAKEKWLEGDAFATIDILLTYYDKAYGTGLSRKRDRIRHRLGWDGRDEDEFARQLVDEVKIPASKQALS